jgi:chromosome partitioning protein
MTWCLADIIASFTDRRALVFDLDAQMSLTQAVTLDTETGHLHEVFQRWYDVAVAKDRTVYHALRQFSDASRPFDFAVDDQFIFPIADRLNFIPSSADLYWMEIESLDRDRIRAFIRRLLGRIQASPSLPGYDYVLFDCPPSFTMLSSSVLDCCDLVLIPVNPDFFAAGGIRLLLRAMRERLAPFPSPKFAVFMNKAKTYGSELTRESRGYLEVVREICQRAGEDGRLDVRFMESYIPERVDIKRAIPAGVPPELIEAFENLWTETARYLHG